MDWHLFKQAGQRSPLWKVYYPIELKDKALNNSHIFHLTAWAKIGKSYVYGVNSDRCSTRFARRYADGNMGYHLHAEMDLLKKIKGTNITEINVVRFSKRGVPTMAKPCKHCQRFLKENGVRKVHYTNWNGEWETMKL